MASSSISIRSEHAYRHVYAILPSCEDTPQGNPDHDAAFVDQLIESVADLRRGGEEGWKLLSVQVRADAQRRHWVDAYLKRRNSAAEGSPSPTEDAPATTSDRQLPKAA